MKLYGKVSCYIRCKLRLVCGRRCKRNCGNQKLRILLAIYIPLTFLIFASRPSALLWSRLVSHPSNSEEMSIYTITGSIIQARNLFKYAIYVSIYINLFKKFFFECKIISIMQLSSMLKLRFKI